MSELQVVKSVVRAALQRGDEIVTKAIEMVLLLNSTPRSIGYIAELVALSALYQINLQMRPGHKAVQYFPDNTDLKTCLLQIANKGLEAFNIAEINSKKILGFIDSVPEKLRGITDTLAVAEDSSLFPLVVPDIQQLLEDVRNTTALVTEVHHYFEILPEQISQLTEAVIHTRSQAEEVVIRDECMARARKFIDDLVLQREERIKKGVEEVAEKNDTFVESKGEDYEGEDEDNIEIFSPEKVQAEMDRKMLMDTLQAVYELPKVPLSGLADQAWFLAYRLNIARKEFMSIKSTTIRRLYKEGYDLAERFADLNILLFNTAMHKQVLELKADVAAWKYEKLSQADAIAIDIEENKPTEQVNINKGHKDMNEVREVLTDSFNVLLNLRSTWRNFVTFFHELQTILEISFFGAVDKYATKANHAVRRASRLVKSQLIAAALDVCKIGFQVSLATASYTQIHSEYFGPNLAKVAVLLGHTNPAQITSLKDEIVQSCAAAEKGIEHLTNTVAQKNQLEYNTFVIEVCGGDGL